MCAALSEEKREPLEVMLVVASDARESRFAQACSSAGRATRRNLKLLTKRYQRPCTLSDPTKPLARIAQGAAVGQRSPTPEGCRALVQSWGRGVINRGCSAKI